MNVQHLVSMANDISAFFDGEAGTPEAPASVALHITRYWDPRMRAQILAHAAEGGDGLCSSALAAVRSLSPPVVRS